MKIQPEWENTGRMFWVRRNEERKQPNNKKSTMTITLFEEGHILTQRTGYIKGLCKFAGVCVCFTGTGYTTLVHTHVCT